MLNREFVVFLYIFSVKRRDILIFNDKVEEAEQFEAEQFEGSISRQDEKKMKCDLSSKNLNQKFYQDLRDNWRFSK